MSPYYYQNLSRVQAFKCFLRIFLESVFSHHSDQYKRAFLNYFQKLYLVSNCFLFYSNRSALFYLLKSLSLSTTDEVLVTAFTCSSVVQAIQKAGLTPVLVDICPRTLGTSLESIQKSISRNSRVVIVQHTFGIPADILAIKKFCNTNNLFLIEDCALSLFSSNTHGFLGTFGDASIWSFELSKTISSGWGGLLSLNIQSNILSSKLTDFSDSLRSESLFLALNRILQALIVRIFIPDGRSKVLNYIVSLAYKFSLFRKSSEVLPDTGFITHDLLWEPIVHQLAHSNSIRATCYRNSSLYFQALHGYIPTNSFLQNINLKTSNLVRFPLMVHSPSHFISFFARRNLQVGEWFRLPSDNSDFLSVELSLNNKFPFSALAYVHFVNLPLYCSYSLASCYQQALLDYIECNPSALVDFSFNS